MKRRFALAVFAAITTLGSLGHTQTGAVVEREANDRFREGVAFFEARDYEHAINSFKMAWALVQDERYLWNEALSELNAGRSLDALKHLEACRRMRVSAAHGAQLDRAIHDARARVTLLSVRAPDGATVLLDGEPVGVAPLAEPIAAAPASAHTIAVRLGGTEATRTLPPQGATPNAIEISLTPSAPVPPTTVNSAAGRPMTPRPPTQPARAFAAGSLLAAGVVSAGLAVYFRVQASSDEEQRSTLSAQIPPQPNRPPQSWCYRVSNQPCADLAAANDASIADRNRAVGLGIAAGGLGIAAVATWLLWPKPRDRVATSRPQLNLAPFGASLLLRY